MTVGELAVLLKLDSKPFDRDLDKSGKRLGGLTRVGHEAKLHLESGSFDSSVDKAGSKLEGLSDVAKKVGGAVGALLAAGAAAGLAAIGKGFADALDVGAVNDKLAAQLGASGDYAADLGKIAGDLYADAYGESLGQVNEALKGVKQNGLLFEDATDEQVKSVTAKVLDLATAFDQDLGQSTAAVGQMLRNGLAKDADEALDILTRGFQQGADKSGDLLDSFNEYSTMFRDLGIDAATATGMLSQGLQAGARDSDTVADALKEFAIRGQDATETSAEGYKALGLSAEDMTAKIAGGGKGASEALDMVLDGLRGTEDPVKRNAAAVALFGTKAEDLGDSLFSLDPSTAVKALGDVEGAAARMGSTLADNAATRLESFKRKGLQRLSDFVGGTVIPAIEGLAGAFGTLGSGDLQGFAAQVDAIFGGSGKLTGPIRAAVTFIRDNMTSVLAGLGTLVATVVVPPFLAWAAATVVALAPIIAIGAAIAALGGGVVYAYQHFEGFRKVVQSVADWMTTKAWPAIQQMAAGVAEAFGEAVVWVRQHWSEIQEAITHVVNVVQGVIRTAVDVISVFWRAWGDDLLAMVQTVWGFISETISNVVRGLQGVISFVLAVINGDWGKAWDSVKQIAGAVWDQISNIISTAVNLVSSVIGGVLSMIAEVWRGVWGGIRDFLGGIWGSITGTVSAALAAIQAVISAVTAGISAHWSAMWGGIRAVVGAAWNAIVSAVTFYLNMVRTVITTVWSAIVTVVTTYINTIRTIVTTVWAGIVTAVSFYINTVRTIISSVLGAITGAWNTAWGAVRDTLSRIWQGIKDNAQRAMDGLKGIVQGAVDSVGRIFRGIKSVFATPINWVIENVLNKFLSGVERIAGALNFNLNLPSVPLVPTAHKGGVVGGGLPRTGGPLRPGERLVKTLDGEEILTRDDPRHIANARRPGPHDTSPLAREPGTGDGWGFVGDAVRKVGAGIGSVVDKVRGVIAQVARPLIEQGLSALGGLAGRFGPPGRLIGGITSDLGHKILDWVAGVDKAAEKEKPIAPPIAAGGGWRALVNALVEGGIAHRVTSTVRPGARTRATGAVSLHSLGRAVDLTGPGGSGDVAGGMKIFDFFGSGGANLSELIYSPAPYYISRGGRRRPIGALNAITEADHWDHVHAALARGGVVTRPTVARLGETAGSRPEIVTPEHLMRRIVAEALDGAGPRGDALRIDHAEFHDDADLEALMRKMDFAVRTGRA